MVTDNRHIRSPQLEHLDRLVRVGLVLDRRVAAPPLVELAGYLPLLVQSAPSLGVAALRPHRQSTPP